MKAGDTFVFKDKAVDEHLWIVVSDPTKDPDEVLVVNSTSHSVDPACVLQPGDHPFVKHESFVNYRDSHTPKDEDLNWWVKTGTLETRKPVSREVLDRIRQGAAQSQFIPEGHRQLLLDQALI